MTHLEKAINRKHTDEELKYFIRFNEINYLCDIADIDRGRGIMSAFAYGFEKGRRCERAKNKKASNPHADQSKGLNANDTPETGCQGHCTTAAGGNQEAKP